MEIKKEKGLVDVPVYMRDYTEKEEYSYIINHKGLEGKIIKRNKNWWIVSNNAKWIVMSKNTKKEAENEFAQFVDNNYDLLKEKAFIN